MKIWVLIGSSVLSILLTEVGLRLFTEPALKEPSRVGNLAVWDDTLGWRSRPDFSKKFYDHIVKTNSLGFRDTEWGITGDNRIILLGDSFGWGWGVSEDSCFANCLEKITGKEVLNMSVFGYSTDQELLLYQKMCNYEHDTVILQLYSNDVWYSVLNHALLYMKKPRLEFLKMDSISNVAIALPSKLEWYEKLHKWSIRHSEIMAKLWFATHRTARVNLTSDDRMNDGLYRREVILLCWLKNLVQDKKFYVFSYAGSDWHGSFGTYENFIKDCREAGVEIIPLDCTELNEKDALWIDEKHWSCKGHRKVAEIMSEYLD